MTIRDELDAINAGMARALAEQDANRFASYYTDDARFLSHGLPIIRGRAEIEAEVRSWFTSGPLTLRARRVRSGCGRGVDGGRKRCQRVQRLDSPRPQRSEVARRTAVVAD